MLMYLFLCCAIRLYLIIIEYQMYVLFVSINSNSKLPVPLHITNRCKCNQFVFLNWSCCQFSRLPDNPFRSVWNYKLPNRSFIWAGLRVPSECSKWHDSDPVYEFQFFKQRWWLSRTLQWGCGWWTSIDWSLFMEKETPQADWVWLQSSLHQVQPFKSVKLSIIQLYLPTERYCPWLIIL